MTPDRIKGLRELCDAATPGPWKDDAPFVVTEADIWSSLGEIVHDHDAVFIGAARSALPEALDEIEELRAELNLANQDKKHYMDVVKQLRAELASYRTPGDDTVEGCTEAQCRRQPLRFWTQDVVP